MHLTAQFICTKIVEVERTMHCIKIGLTFWFYHVEQNYFVDASEVVIKCLQS